MLHTVAARQVARASQQGLRASSVRAAAPRLTGHSMLAQRMASSSTQAAGQQVKSDAPWAIGSVVVFGSMFIYLTSPSKGGAHGHDSHGDHHGGGGGSKKGGDAEAGAAKDEEEESEEEEEGEEPSSGNDGDEDQGENADQTPETSDEEDEYVNVHKIEEKPGDNAPSGAKVLAENSLTAEEGAHLQKPTKGKGEGSIQRRDDSTFQHGLKASKEGNKDPTNRDAVISNPKVVVAAAQTEQRNKAASKEAEASGNDGEKEESE